MNLKVCCMSNQRFKNNLKHLKILPDHFYFSGIPRGAAHSIHGFEYLAPREISIVFYNGSNCDFHLMIKNLAKIFCSNDFECLGKHVELYTSTFVSLDKKIKEIDVKPKRNQKKKHYIQTKAYQ